MDATQILLLEDEIMILMDLDLTAEDHGCEVHTATSAERALTILDQHGTDIDVAVLDVSLGKNSTCFPVARQLDDMGIPYILHSGDLNRHNERIQQLDADLIAKPAPADHVISAALAKMDRTPDRIGDPAHS